MGHACRKLGQNFDACFKTIPKYGQGYLFGLAMPNFVARFEYDVPCLYAIISFFLKDYTVQRKRSQHTYTYPYKRMHTNSNPMSTFEGRAGKSWRRD